jgi:three-Cys-motif partner protein
VAIKFDEIGYWSELKLEIVEKYGAAYANILKKQPFKKYYIDGFSGAGEHISKDTGKRVDGSPQRALKISPQFDGYYFIDMNPDKTAWLQNIARNRTDVHIHTGDCNEYLTKQLLPTIHYEQYNRALCLLDPYGLHLDWEVIRMAGHSNAIDMFLNFPIMDINRNVIWKNPDDPRIRDDDRDRMNRFWGDESWRQIAYKTTPTLFPDMLDTEKQDNETVVNAFVDRLKKVANFKFVAKPLPMKNAMNAVVYYLIHASQKELAHDVITDIFRKYA